MKASLRVSLITIAAFFFFPDIVAAQNDTVRNTLAVPQGWRASVSVHSLRQAKQK
jgi:hypothetical protein